MVKIFYLIFKKQYTNNENFEKKQKPWLSIINSKNYLFSTKIFFVFFIRVKRKIEVYIAL